MPSRAVTPARILRAVPLLLLLCLLVVLVAIPVGVVVVASFTDHAPGSSEPSHFILSNYAKLWSGRNLSALTNSLVISAFGTVIATVVGVGLAVLAARTDVALRRVVNLAGVVPLFMTSLTGALAWGILGSPRGGFVELLLHSLGLPGFVDIYSTPGIVFVFGLYYAPYSFLFMSGAMRLLDPQLEEAARVHGANLRRTLREVTLPLAAPAALGAALVSFVLMMENFTVPGLLGTRAHVTTVSTRIFYLMNTVPSHPNQAAGVGMFLLIALVVLTVIQTRLVAGRSFATITGKGMRPRVIRLGWWRWPAFLAAAGYLVLAVILPMLTLLNTAIRPYAYISRLSQLFDLRTVDVSNLTNILTGRDFRLSLTNSLLAGALTAIAGTVLHYVIAHVNQRSRSPLRPLITGLAMAPLAFPHLLLGIGILWTWLWLPVPIYGTLVILAVAYITQFTPQGYRSAVSVIGAVHPDLEDSAMTCGAHRLRAVTWVTLPLIRGGVVSTALLLLLLSMRELSASLFLFTSHTRVLSITIFEAWESGQVDQAAGMSLGFSIVLMFVTVVGLRWLRGSLEETGTA